MKDMKEKIRKAMSFIRRNKVTTKVISFVLSLVLVFYVIPSSIYAEAAELFSDKDEIASDGLASDESAVVGTAAPSRDILLATYEDEALREESVKHFHLSDGSYVAAQYTFPVHYIDESGEWQDIDNALADSGSEYANNNARIKFAKKITGNESLFTLHDGNTKITLSLVGANKGTVGSVTNNSDSEEETELQKMMNLEKLSSKILYADILDGIDLEYVAYSHNVKENIIVKEKKDSYVYSFELKLNGLTPTLTESGDIQLTDDESGEIKYNIPAPVVFDASGAYAPSQMGSYTLEYHNGKKYTLTVSVNPDWMNDEDRVFPVTVDPTIGVPHQHTIDLEIMSSAPNLNLESDFSLTVSATARSYWKIPSEYLPALSASSYISKAELKLFGGGNNCYVGAYNVISDWDETLTWAKTISASPQGTFGDTVYDYNSITYGDSWYGFDITQAVRQWYNGGNNYGIGLKLIDESDTTKSATFYSYEYYDDYDDRYTEPCFYVSYTDLGGLEGYLSYSSHSAGIAGSGSINLANGNLVFAIPTLTTTDGIFGYTPTLYYNSYLAGKDYTYANTKTAYSSSYMPYGFKLNICETVIQESYTDPQDVTATYYIHADADGTEHAYLSSGVSGTYYDEDALGKTMTVAADKIEITDDSHIIKRFCKMTSTPSSSVTSAWYLAEIEDTAGNKLIFEMDETHLRPVKVKLAPKNVASIELLRLLYVNNKLAAVFNDRSNDSVILRYADGKLTSVENCYGNYELTEAQILAYCSGTPTANLTVYSTETYTYDSAGHIISVADSDSGKSLSYTLSGGKITQISEYSGTTLGQQISYTYGEQYTDVRSTGNDEQLNTADDIATRYIFDNHGRAVSRYSFMAESKEILGATVGAYDTQENSKNSLKEQTVIEGVNSNLLLNGDFQSYLIGFNRTVIRNWTQSSDVIKNMTAGIGATHPDSISFSPTSGSDSYIYQNLTLESGKYTLTVNYTTDTCNGITGIAQIINASDGAVIGSVELDLNEATTPKTDSAVLHVDLPQATQITVKILFSVVEATASAPTISAGMVKLEKGNTSTDYTLLDYGNFEDVELSGWTTDSGSDITTVTDTDQCLKITADGPGDNYVKKTLYSATLDRLTYADNGYQLPDNPEYKFSVSGFAKGVDVIPSKPFRLRVDVTYYYGQSEEDVTVSHYYDFRPDCADWQFVSGTFSLDKDAQGSSLPLYKCVKSVVVYCDFSDQAGGYALFDNITVTYVGFDKIQSSTYNSDGRLVVSQNGYYTEYYVYDEYGNHSRIANSHGELLEYEYNDDNPYLLSHITKFDYSYRGQSSEYPYAETDPDCTLSARSRTVYNYSHFHLLMSVVEQKASDNAENPWENVSTTSYTYIVSNASTLFGTMLSETNSEGHTTKYFYDQNKGYLLATVDMTSGTGYSYTYDSRGRLLAVNPATYTANQASYVKVSNAEEVVYSYDSSNRLDTISTESTVYTFYYDVYGNSSKIEAGDNTLAEYTYNQNNGKLNRVDYGNDFYVEYVYDEKEQLTEVKYNGTVRYRYEYTSDGQIYRLNDLANGTYTVYYYDLDNRLKGFKEYDSESGERNISSEIGYDYRSYISDIRYDYTYQSGSSDMSDYLRHSYTYRNDGAVVSESAYSVGMSFNASYTYDYLDRISEVVYNTGSTGFTGSVDYTYHVSDNGETGLVEKYTSTAGSSVTEYTYTYDSKGNITRIEGGSGYYVTYTYDDVGQLVNEYNKFLNKTYTYSYDNAGNIAYIKYSNITSDSGLIIKSIGEGESAAPNALPLLPVITVSYGYSDSEWGDLLTSYNGHAITYDETGNPLSYYNGTSFTFTWEGRRLLGATKGNMQMSFAYNDEGLRTSKTVDGVTTNYYYDGSLLIKEETPTYTTVYIYDINGSPIGFKSRKSTYADGVWDAYYYEKNLQGDITTIRNSSGTILATYKYNAWGDALRIFSNGGATTTAANNHLTYRGYYYDYDLGMYYLQSRYYDQKVGRFINADDVMSDVGGDIRGYNLFAYCMNNPINRVDPTGNWPSWATKLVASIAVVAAVAVVAAITVATAGAGTAAAVIAVGAAKGAAIGMASGAAIGAATGAVSHRVSTGSWSGAGTAALNGMGDGALSGAVTGAITGAVGSTLKVGQAAKAWDASSKGGSWANMSDHYRRHVLEEGKKSMTRNVITYTNDAKALWVNNNGAGKLMASGSLRLKGSGIGGFYSNTGLIRSFFYQ